MGNKIKLILLIGFFVAYHIYEIKAENYKSILPYSIKTIDGIVINYGEDMKDVDSITGKSKIEYIVDLTTKLLEKDRKESGKIIKQLQLNKPHLVNFNNFEDIESRKAEDFFDRYPKSQDLEAEEVFPNANLNHGEDINTRERDASVEEIVHLIHNYGISDAYPEIQKDLDKLTDIAYKKGYLDFEGTDLPREDLDDEYLAACVEAYYGVRASKGYIRKGLKRKATREDLKKFDIGMYNIINQLFPESLDLGYKK